MTVIMPDQSLTTMIMVLTMTAGTGMIMWLGELHHRAWHRQMDVHPHLHLHRRALPGVVVEYQGRGQLDHLLPHHRDGVVTVALVIFVEQSQRRIPVQYAKRMVGRRMYGGTSTYIPIKVNMAGVIPVIFASSLLALPGLVAQFNTHADGKNPAGSTGSTTTWSAVRNRSTWRSTSALIIFFTFFYVEITFNPQEVADNMKKHGGFILASGPAAPRPTTCRTSSTGSRSLGGLPRCDLAHSAHRVRPCAPTRTSRSAARHPDHCRCRSRDREARSRHSSSNATMKGSCADATAHPGPPGKETQASRVAERYGIPAISTGRSSAAISRPRPTWAKQVEAILAAGDYVPDEMTNAIVADRLHWADAAPGFLRRVPRTMGQVEALDGLLSADGLALDAVLEFSPSRPSRSWRACPRAEIEGPRRRHRGRHTPTGSRSTTTDRTLGSEVPRPGILVQVDGMGEVDEVTDRIVAALDAATGR